MPRRTAACPYARRARPVVHSATDLGGQSTRRYPSDKTPRVHLHSRSQLGARCAGRSPVFATMLHAWANSSSNISRCRARPEAEPRRSTRRTSYRCSSFASDLTRAGLYATNTASMVSDSMRLAARLDTAIQLPQGTYQRRMRIQPHYHHTRLPGPASRLRPGNDTRYRQPSRVRALAQCRARRAVLACADHKRRPSAVPARADSRVVRVSVADRRHVHSQQAARRKKCGSPFHAT